MPAKEHGVGQRVTSMSPLVWIPGLPIGLERGGDATALSLALRGMELDDTHCGEAVRRRVAFHALLSGVLALDDPRFNDEPASKLSLRQGMPNRHLASAGAWMSNGRKRP